MCLCHRAAGLPFILRKGLWMPAACQAEGTEMKPACHLLRVSHLNAQRQPGDQGTGGTGVGGWEGPWGDSSHCWLCDPQLPKGSKDPDERA